MRQCHVLGLVNYRLQSLIKGNGHYVVMGLYSPSDEGKQAVYEEKPLILRSTEKSIPQEKYSHTSSNSSSSSISGEIVSEGKGKQKRDGKGSNILLLVRKLLKCPENCLQARLPVSWHFPYPITTTALLHPKLF